MTINNPRTTILDTETDSCLFRAPRDSRSRAYQRGRDLYLHQGKDFTPIYYLHRWSRKKGENQRLSVISNIMASRFLEERGLLCPDAGDQRAGAILRNWGYGILEEF
jgi:hypothetical protein